MLGRESTVTPFPSLVIFIQANTLFDRKIFVIYTNSIYVRLIYIHRNFEENTIYAMKILNAASDETLNI